MELKIHTFKEDNYTSLPKYELIFKPEESLSFIGLIDEKSTLGKRFKGIVDFLALNSDTTKIVSFDISKRVMLDARIGIEYRKDDLVGKIFVHIFNGRTLTRCSEVVQNTGLLHWRTNRKTSEFDLLAFFHKKFLDTLANRKAGDQTIDII